MPRTARVRPPIDGQVLTAISLEKYFYPVAETTEEKRHRRRRETLERALEKIQANKERPYSLKDLARDMHVHPRHMQRIFASAGSGGFSLELRKIRLDWSKKLLLQGESVSKTSKRLCYSHPSHFSKAFKKEYGLLPSQWISVARKSAKKS